MTGDTGNLEAKFRKFLFRMLCFICWFSPSPKWFRRPLNQLFCTVVGLFCGVVLILGVSLGLAGEILGTGCVSRFGLTGNLKAGRTMALFGCI